MKITSMLEFFRREETAPPLFNKNGPRNDLLFVLVNIVSFIALSLIVFERHESVLFLRYDGTYHLTLAANQLDWMGRIPLLTMDYLKANGEISVPLMSRLTPAWVLGSWLAGGGGGRAP